MDNNNMSSETLSLIHQGCNLARELESNLPNLANQPETVSNSLEDIIRAFRSAREAMRMQNSNARVVQQQQRIDAGLQEWLRCNNATECTTKELGAEMLLQSQIHQAMDHIVTVVSHEINNSDSSSQGRPRRRRDNGEIRKFTVPAPIIGNTEIPPEDGFTWRKYGQKDIMGCKFPRGYYRCTHLKLYNCPAKKQVQRLDNDPLSFEVMYIGDHTCHMSSTAPSILPQPDHIKQETTPPLGTWLSMDFNPNGEGSSGGGGRGEEGDSLGASVATTTLTRDGKDVEFPVVDLADAMFNSGSSSSNSMNFMFISPMENE